MKKSKDYDPGLRTAILIVGDPGTRKTSLCLQFPKPYIFDADNNLAGPTRAYPDIEFSFDNGHVTSEDWVDKKLGVDYKEGDAIKPEHRYLWMAKCLNEASKSDEVQTIVVDSLTSVSEFIMSEIKRQERMKDDATMRIQDWGKYSYFLKNLVVQLKTTEKLVVFTAHNVVDKDESDGRFKTFLAVPGQSKHTLSGLFNDVWCNYLKQSGAGSAQKHEWRVRTLPNGDNDHRGLKESLGLDKTFKWGTEPLMFLDRLKSRAAK